MSAPASFALVTPSYAGDIERCRLLCESVDTFAEGTFRHYLLVADHDLDLFRPLQGPRRSVIPESGLLPRWLRPVRRPFDRQRRHMWISTDIRRQFRPLSGWHAQQLRKIAAARLVDEPIIVMADSDSLFLRPFGVDNFQQGDLVRLYRNPASIPAAGGQNATGSSWELHRSWTRSAATLLGLPEPAFPADDFINNLVSWRKDRAIAMIDRIEGLGAAPFPLLLARAAAISEYQIYGAFVSGPGGMDGHFDSAEALSHTYWAGSALDRAGMEGFIAGLQPAQIAVCVQSFTQTPLDVMRSLISAGNRRAART